MSEVFFGNTPGATSGVAANFVYFSPATCTQSGNVTHMRTNAASTASSGRLAVYAATGSPGNPGAFIGQSDTFSIVSGLNTPACSTPFAVTNGTTYWLAWLLSTSPPNMGFGASGNYGFLAATYPTFPGSGSGYTNNSPNGVIYVEAGVTPPGGGSTFVPLISSMFKAAGTWENRRRGILVPDIWTPHPA